MDIAQLHKMETAFSCILPAVSLQTQNAERMSCAGHSPSCQVMTCFTVHKTEVVYFVVQGKLMSCVFM